MTSEPTKALVAAVKGQPYHIPFSGAMQFQLASDVARQFILAAQRPLDGAFGFNLGGAPATVHDFVDIAGDILPDARIEVADNPLPFPEGFDDSALRDTLGTVYDTPLPDGIAETITQMQRLGNQI